MTEEESLSKPLEEQYALAGERYDALYERVTAMQQDVCGGEWRSRGVNFEALSGSEVLGQAILPTV